MRVCVCVSVSVSVCVCVYILKKLLWDDLEIRLK